VASNTKDVNEVTVENGVEDGPDGSSKVHTGDPGEFSLFSSYSNCSITSNVCGCAVVEGALPSTTSGTTSESANIGSSAAPILIDIPLNDDGTMGPVTPVDHGSPLVEPDFNLQNWSPPPANSILHPVTPPPSAMLPDPTFSFSPPTASQNPWKADRTFEF
jgi:hypothetical protein